MRRKLTVHGIVNDGLDDEMEDSKHLSRDRVARWRNPRCLNRSERRRRKRWMGLKWSRRAKVEKGRKGLGTTVVDSGGGRKPIDPALVRVQSTGLLVPDFSSTDGVFRAIEQ